MNRKVTKSNIEIFHNNGLFIPTRTIYIGSMREIGENNSEESGVDFEEAKNAIKNIHILDSINHKQITIILNDVGGDEYHGFAIYDALKKAKSPIKIIVYGQAMSMGSIILQAGNKRLIMPNSVLMIHDGTAGVNTESKSAESWGRESKRIREQMYQIYYSKMKKKRITLKEIEKMCEHDNIITPKRAIKLGLADKII